MLEPGPDTTTYRKLSSDHVRVGSYGGAPTLEVDPEGLKLLAAEAFKDVNHLLRSEHLASLSHILEDPEASDNDRFVARELLRNAVIAAQGVLPSCQDTGTAIVIARKGHRVMTDGHDERALTDGITQTYTETNLRYSHLAPLSMFEEKNTGDNLPAQVDIMVSQGEEYHFLFLAKGGGSANKTFLFQETKALLNPDSLRAFIGVILKKLGTAACPPYHLALVVGGTSAEMNLKTVKLASARYLDTLPTTGDETGRAYRDLEWEEEMLRMAQQSGIGAQVGGKYFAHDARVIRLPRHGASCPVGLGVSCSADRQIKAKITSEGIFLEELEQHPERFLIETGKTAEMMPVDLNRPMDEICAQLSKYPIGTGLALTGDIVVARDIAHARLKKSMDEGNPLPDYIKDNIVYYAGPAKTPKGMPSGSFGPTTAQRMDPYIPIFQEKGASLITLAKGNRGPEVTDSCKAHGGFYLGSIGGPAARLASANITSMEIIDFPELGMEAIYRISVVDFPAFIIVDDKGNDFFAKLLR